MSSASLSKFYKLTVIGVGGLCLLWALTDLPDAVLGWRFALLLAFTVLVTPRMSFTLPRSKFILSFSDSIIYLTFIFFGGAAAVSLAAVETLINCLYLRRKGIKFGQAMIPFNIAMVTLTAAIGGVMWSAMLNLTAMQPLTAHTEEIILALSGLAIVQFFAASILVAGLSAMMTGKSFLRTWWHECFASSLTHIAGAGLAFVAYKLLVHNNLLITLPAILVFAIIYINYRQTIREINESIGQAELAERERTEIVRVKAAEAERYNAELKSLLDKKDQINEALTQSKIALEHAAFHDFLTDLPNRTFLVERLNLLMEPGIEISHNYYVLFLDLRRFKNINSRLGHSIGDRVLKFVGKRLVRLLSKEDTVARIGGDEFAIILNNSASLEEAELIAWGIYEKLTQPFNINSRLIFSDLHIGIAPCDVEYHAPEEILRDADIARQNAKSQSAGVVIFDKQLRADYLEKISLEADLRFAVERGELSMNYQPLIDLNDGSLIGFEALLRWHHTRKGFISPAKFIPIAEDSGLIIPLTGWILQESCSQIARWQNLAPNYANLLISVNISGKHLTDVGLVKDVKQVLKNTGIAPVTLKLEITESAAMDDAEQSIAILKNLKTLGVQLSIDDFGTGYSSLAYLHRLPFDSLKIDRSFVSGVGAAGEDSKILQTIVSLAKNLRLRTFAEGIETREQFAIMRNFGCDYGQGYLMSKPLPQDQMETLLYQNHCWLPALTAETEASPKTRSAENNSLSL